MNKPDSFADCIQDLRNSARWDQWPEMASCMKAVATRLEALARAAGEPPAQPMTASRAAYFMERFKREEKLLGPNEKAAIDFVLAMLADRAEGPALPRRFTVELLHKVYRNTPEWPLYLRARFATPGALSFEWEGHRWAYRVSAFDDDGDYDLLWRPDDVPSSGAEGSKP